MHRERIVVCNSTVIIAFSFLGLLDILKLLYREIIIAQEVYDELVRGEGRPGSEIKDLEWIRIRAISDARLKEYLGFNLDKGEAETIALSEEIKADLALLDDYWARKFAERRNLTISGTLGVLIKAKKKGMVDRIKPLLDKLIEFDFWIGEDLYRNVLQEVEEL